MSGIPPGVGPGLAERYRLGGSEEWRKLLTHFAFSESFAFLVLLVPDADGAALCRAALERRLAETGRSVLPIAPATPAELVSLAGRMLQIPVPQETGAIWVEAAVSEGVPECAEWRAAWFELAARLNQVRNAIQRFPVPLLFVGAPWLQEVLREAAPDLWSIRTLVARVEPPPREPGVRPTPDGRVTPDENAPDPEFALRMAERLRGRPGKEAELAALLHRAAAGFAARYQWNRAVEAFREALALREEHAVATVELADTLSELGSALVWQSDYPQGEALLCRARELFAERGEVQGQANAGWRLGDAALRRSDHAGAMARYEEALPSSARSAPCSERPTAS